VSYVERSTRPTCNIQASCQCFERWTMERQVSEVIASAMNASKMTAPRPESTVRVWSCHRPFIVFHPTRSTAGFFSRLRNKSEFAIQKNARSPYKVYWTSAIQRIEAFAASERSRKAECLYQKRLQLRYARVHFAGTPTCPCLGSRPDSAESRMSCQEAKAERK
jgi:hypothetical protein